MKTVYPRNVAPRPSTLYTVTLNIQPVAPAHPKARSPPGLSYAHVTARLCQLKLALHPENR